MKSIGNQLFLSTKLDGVGPPRPAYRRVFARDIGLPESWFRDAIHGDPDLVIGACREAGRVAADEVWLPWGTEVFVDAGPIDVLLLSSRGRIGIVETKLSYNPEKRRTVVAQVLDYAFAMQGMSLDELPSLPGGDFSPDPADIEECLANGRFLLVIAGDAMDPRALRLSEGLLGRHLTSEWDLAMVDINLFQSMSGDAGVLLVPELRGTVASEVRQVVRVQVEGSAPKARVEVEHVVVSAANPVRPGKLSTDGFFERMTAKAPARVEHARRVVGCFQQVERDSAGRLMLDLQSATANMYLETPLGRKRVLALNTDGRFRVWLDYLNKSGQSGLAEVLRREASALIPIAPGTSSEAVWLGSVDIAQLLDMIQRVGTALTEGLGTA